jgi:hypothetical protein
MATRYFTIKLTENEWHSILHALGNFTMEKQSCSNIYQWKTMCRAEEKIEMELSYQKNIRITKAQGSPNDKEVE